MKGFNTADSRVLQGLTRLKAPEMYGLYMFLQEQLTDAQAGLITADTDARFRRLQGRAGYIKELLDAVEQAASVVEKA